jgi:hypothetical protein
MDIRRSVVSLWTLCTVVLWCSVFASTLRARDTRDSVADVLRKLETNPSENDIVDAVQRLSSGATEGQGPKLVADLRACLSKPDKKLFVLRGLAQYREPEFDFDLALLIPDPTGPPPADFNDLIGAIKTSGGLESLSVLTVLGASNGAFFPSVPSHMPVWQALSSIDVDTALDELLGYFAPVSGQSIDQASADLLNALIDRAQNQIARHVRPISLFLGYPQVSSGGTGSPRYQVHKKILQVLLQRKTPLSLSTALMFTASDAADLAHAASTADYSPLASAPWLIPVDTIAFRPPGSDPHSWQVLKRYGIGLPNDLLALPPGKFGALNAFELAAVANGAARLPHANHPDTQSVLQGQFAFATALLTLIQHDYGLTTPTFNNVNAQAAPPAPNIPLAGPPPTQYELVDFAASAVEPLVAQGIKSLGVATEEVNPSAHFVVSTELERLSLVLYALVSSIAVQGAHAQALNFSTLDDQLDAISASDAAPVIIRSQAVGHLDALTPTQQGDRIALLHACASPKVTLNARQYSLSQGLYSENLKISCDGTPDKVLNWVGEIPLPLVVPIKRHVRLLDFPNVSLVVRELSTRRTIGWGLDDVDLIRAFPLISMSYLAAAALHPEIPWRYVQDALAYEESGFLGGALLSEVFAFVNAPTMASAGMAELPRSGVMPVTVYQADKATAQASVAKWINAKASLDGNQALQAWVNNNVANYSCRSTQVCSFSPEGGMSCSPLTTCSGNSKKSEFINTSTNQIRQASAELNLTAAWEFDDVAAASVSRIEPIRTYINSDFSEYTGVYRLLLSNGHEHYVTITKALSAFPVWARLVLLDDQFFLDRVQADVAGGSTDGATNLATALALALPRNPALIAYRLRNSDLLTIASQVTGSHLSPKPLTMTATGQTVASELAELIKVRQDFDPFLVQPSNGASPEFVANILQEWKNARNQEQASVNSQVAKAIDQIHRSNTGGWSIGVGWGPMGISLGLSIGNWSFSLSNSGPTGMVAVGFSGFTIPIPVYQFTLPQNLTPPGLAGPLQLSPPPPVLR